MTHEAIRDAIVLFMQYAETRLNNVEVETQDGVTMYRVMLAPYNKSKVDRLYIWKEGDKTSIQVAGQTPGEAGAESGFLHSSARAETTGEFDAEGLCAFIVAVSRGMR